MSNETQTIAKYVIGTITSIFLLIVGVNISSYVEQEKKESESLEKILQFITLYEYRMVEVEKKVEQLDLNDREFEKVFSASLEKITSSRAQLQESDYYKKNSNK